MAEVACEPRKPSLIEGFITADTMTMLSGHPKTFGRKSLLAMNQCLALVTGKQIAAFKPAAQVPVLYCYHEGGRYSTYARFRMLCQGANIDVESAQDFFFLHRSLMDLRSKADVSLIGSWCRDNKVGLVVFDTLAKSMMGDEDSAENIGRVVRGVEEARSYGMAVLLLHHLSKSTPSMVGGQFDPDRDMRGSGALAGAYEAHQAVRHYAYNNQRADLLVSNKDGEEFAHKHRWEFQNAKLPNGQLDLDNSKTILHMGPEIPWSALGVLDEDEITELMAYIAPNRTYTLQMLASLWKVSQQAANDIIGKLMNEDQLESAKYGGYRMCEG